jgi:hypothetical protein
MLYESRIKIESAFLGSKNQSGIMVFARDKDGGLIIPADQWEWAVLEACTSLRLSSIEPKCFHPPLPIYVPTTTLYSRNYTRAGQKEECRHESIRKGAELTVDMIVSSSSPPRASMEKNREAPGQSDIEQILKFIGLFLGLSPFGSEKGYGRFKLMSVETKIPTLE